MNRSVTVFPFYDDEIYFSWLSRYHIVSVNRTGRYTSEQIFGCVPNVRPDRAFLLDRFFQATGFDPDYIIESHSAVPYYRPSLKRERFDRLVRSVRESASTAYPVYSAGANRQAMKYCPLCAREETEAYGIPYWHASHNLDGVTLCPKHRVRLLDDHTTFAGRRRTYALPPYSGDDSVVYESGRDELQINALIQDCWRTEGYSRTEILTLIRTFARTQFQSHDYYQRLTGQLLNDRAILKLVSSRGIGRTDFTSRIRRLLKDPNVSGHPFYTYLVRDYLGLTRTVAEEIVAACPGILDRT